MRNYIFIVLFVINSIATSYSQSRWAFDINFGAVYNVPMPLIISQQGHPDIKLMARYYTEPFTPPVYWDWRFSRWQNGKSWEFEAIHHKLYLRNKPAEVQKFSISHGFNIININRGFEKKNFIYRTGLGIVLSHPESNIRGLEFGDSGDPWDMGYYISGPIVNAAINKPFRFGSRFFINAEAKTSLAYSYTKVVRGHADVFSFAFHFIFGFGFDFIKPIKNN